MISPRKVFFWWNTTTSTFQRTTARITEIEVRKAILQLNIETSPGLDALPIEDYKSFTDILASRLTDVFTDALQIKRLPESFREVLITLIPRKRTET